MGGKRKKSNNGPLKKESKYKIPSRFDCPLCDAKSSIAVKIARATGDATVYCRSCKVGLGRRWPILKLEKAVDVFFRFREELMNLDRQYLEGHNIEATGVPTGDAKNLAELSRVARGGRSATAAAASRQRVRGSAAAEDDSDMEDTSHYFAPREEEHDVDNALGGHDDDEYAALFQ